MNDYTNILREHNLKATPQRLAITDVLFNKGHVSIEELYKTMVKKFKSISLATIYKNINLMIENAFILEVKIPNSKSVYELTKETHSHLVCTECNSVEDIYLDLDFIIKATSSKNRFNVNSTDLVLSGICNNCQYCHPRANFHIPVSHK